jgi:hypothetical protein
MAFPTIPTTAASRLFVVTQANTTNPRTFPTLSDLTKNSGDLLIAICIEFGGTSAGNQFGSWGASFIEFGDFSTTDAISIGCAYKFSDGTETGTFSVTSSITPPGHAALILMSIPDAHASTPPEAGGYITASLANADSGSLDPAGWGTDDTLWMTVAGCGETGTAGSFTGIATTNPTNYTGIAESGISQDIAGGIEGAIAFRQRNAASEDPAAFSNDVSAARAGAITIAVRPVPPVVSSLDQVAYRGYADDAAMGSATPKANQNVGWTQVVDQNFRIRFEIQQTTTYASEACSVECQYNLNGGAWGAADNTTNVIQTATSPHVTNQAATVDTLTAGTGTFVTGRFIEAPDWASNSISFPASGHTEVEFCLKIIAADVVHNDEIQLKASRVAGGDFEAWSQIATVTVSESADTNAPATQAVAPVVANAPATSIQVNAATATVVAAANNAAPLISKDVAATQAVVTTVASGATTTVTTNATSSVVAAVGNSAAPNVLSNALQAVVSTVGIDATVNISQSANAPATPAVVTTVANNASIDVQTNATVSAVGAVANNAAESVVVNAITAVVSALANDATVSTAVFTDADATPAVVTATSNAAASIDIGATSAPVITAANNATTTLLNFITPNVIDASATIPQLTVRHQLYPDAILLQTGLTGAVGDIDDDPDFPDGSWLTTTAGTDTDLRVSFPTPGAALQAGAGLQEFRVLVRTTGENPDPSVRLELWEAGVFVSTLVTDTAVSSTTGTVISGTWNSSGRNPADIELRVVGTSV